MPAEIITASFCADYWADFEVESQSGSGETYTVTMNGGEGIAHCTCKAYEYSGNNHHCKHIDYVFQNGCFWNPQWYDGGSRKLKPKVINGSTIPGEKCPRCGGPMIAVRIAV